jgi:hypothetical protein
MAMNLGQMRKYGIEMQEAKDVNPEYPAKSNSDTIIKYRLFDGNTGKHLTEWLRYAEVQKQANKLLGQRIGGFTGNIVERHNAYFGRVILNEEGSKLVELEKSLICKSGSLTEVNWNIIAVLRRNYIVSGVSSDGKISGSGVTLLRTV